MKQNEVIQELQQLSPLLAGIGNQMPYPAPAGYFESLELRLEAVLETTAEKSSLLNNETARNNIFKVPDGYFEKLPNTVLQQVQPQAQIVPLFTSRTFKRLAAAVVALLLISTGVRYMWLQQNHTPGADVIAAGLQIKTERQFQQELEQIDANTLVEYLNSTAATSVTSQADDLVPQNEAADLPSETDLLDEDFLDAYLNELEKTETLN